MRSACFYLLLPLMTGMLTATAQEVIIKGRVVNPDGDPLQGANVFIKGTVSGSSTDETGAFSFATTIRGDTVLVARHVAMETREIAFSIDSSIIPIMIMLHQRYNLLDEASVSISNYAALDNNRSISLTTMDVDTSPGSDGDVTTALRDLPGVQAIGESGALFVRGGSDEESKTFIDGLEITHPYFTGVPDIAQRSRYSPHLFEGITFSTGGYAPAYGGALSSILSLDTRNHPQKNSTVLALIPYGAQLGHDRLFSETTSAGFDVGYSNFGPYYNLIHHRTDWIRAPENWMANANFRQNTPGKGIIKWFGYANTSSQSANLPDVNAQGLLRPLYVANDNAVSLLTFQQPLSRGNGSVYIGYGFNFNKDNLRTTDHTAETRQSQHQLRIAVHRPLSASVRLDVGTEGYLVHFESAPYATPIADRKVAAWTELTVAALGRATIRSGVRVDYSRLLPRPVLSPRITGSYQLTTADRISLVVGSYTQQPAYSYPLPTQHPSYQRATHYIANFQRGKDGKTLRIETYHKAYHGLLTTAASSGTNDGTGFAYGLDAFWRDQQSVTGLDYWISYSWLHTKRRYLDYPISTAPTFASPHTFHAVAKQFIQSWGIFIGASYTLAAGRPYFNPLNPVFLADRTPVYHNVNVNTAVLRKWGNTFITLVAALNNVVGSHQVFNYQYADDGSFHMPIARPYGRSLLLGLFISMGKDRSDELLNQLP
ncbi:TonB-dependent receptor [Parapedobacter koreensis]|uniref:TonB-dependent Receptor Plug Domain n=1 Tax=Parapedobacter koreensis TaxID=332977 RepID=A0A1H7IYU1_9SPHI|nr:carboxypeptidase-like regulatory domain-containing protein [Parapedobacter koreensis]SEK67374.1 TonB-dependent Receptor Plug Domain [Parapedobacter koreensis]